ncbi:hypothetical protein [Methanobacterium petrolearium]|uniref:hypothetical protein n=1 Tax=Methanobacterium petrolearium TaxID=710190 RepID=UPI001AE5171A|nr:hypothetical protein [Methanobacterium petrolearium]MBP1946565.1 hypothetical protein [Methanobacterium petrolearium]BDZ69912.1 hypothetical protein GCM10025861_04290 [Methanobacterium petrolearium]
MKTGCYEEYPLKIVILCNALSISIYIIGVFILYGLGILFSVLYLLFCLIIEIRLMKGGCVNCYYYGKTCAFGKGRLSSYFFKKGNPELFTQKNVSWYAVLPDFLVFLFPLTGGIILLINKFSWITILLIIIILILGLGGNAFVRSLTCKHCQQKELGCPAAELFDDER